MTCGEITLKNGDVFKWQLSGTTTPEIYGWVERNYSIVKGTAGFYRTTDPERAKQHAEIAAGN